MIRTLYNLMTPLYADELERVAMLRGGRQRGRQAALIAGLRYHAGRRGLQILLATERRVAELEAQVALAEAQLSSNLVSFFLAPGGGRPDEIRTSSRAG